jgi:hypothetical protein
LRSVGAIIDETWTLSLLLLPAVRYVLQRYWEEGDKFLDRIVTGDETWVQFVNAETKQQSKRWMHMHSPNKPKKFK